MKSDDYWDVPKRAISLKLYSGRYDEKENKLLSALDYRAQIEFGISENVTSSNHTAKITVGGIMPYKMFDLATYHDTWSANRPSNSLMLEAGYEGNKSLVFKGPIIKATPDLSKADHKIVIDGHSHFAFQLEDPLHCCYKGEVDVLDIVHDLAKAMKCAVNSSLPYKAVNFRSYNESGSFTHHLQKLSEFYGLHIWAHSDVIYVKERTQPIKANPYKIGGNEMVGSPRISSVGVDVTLKLNPALRLGQEVSLTSKNFPKLNSQSYVVNALIHKGNTRGSDWTTELKCVLKGLDESKLDNNEDKDKTDDKKKIKDEGGQQCQPIGPPWTLAY